MAQTIAFIILWMILTTFFLVHELGHLIACKLYGVEVRVLRVGILPFLTFNIKGITVEIGLLPFFAYVESILEDLSVFKRCFIYLAGPLASLLLGMSFVLFSGKDFIETLNIGIIGTSILPIYLLFDLSEISLLSGISIFDSALSMEVALTDPATHDSLAFFFGLVNIVIAGGNLLPIPPLDGGNIFFDLLEHFVKNPKKIKSLAYNGESVTYISAIRACLTGLTIFYVSYTIFFDLIWEYMRSVFW